MEWQAAEGRLLLRFVSLNVRDLANLAKNLLLSSGSREADNGADAGAVGLFCSGFAVGDGLSV